MSENGKNRTTAIVLAAGRGKRMNSRVQKQYLSLGGRPVLYYSLKAFQDSSVDEIILVTGKEEIEYVRSEIVERYGFTKVRAVVEGGRERYHSVFCGLQAAGELWKAGRDGSEPEAASRDFGRPEHYCLIHDGARPFLTEDILARVMDSVVKDKACIVGMPVKDTIKLADGEGFADSTPPRSRVWMIQTPQAFSFELIYGAYAELMEREQELTASGVQITDDAGVVELLADTKVRLVEGSYENIKITTPDDLKIAETFLK